MLKCAHVVMLLTLLAAIFTSCLSTNEENVTKPIAQEQLSTPAQTASPPSTPANDKPIDAISSAEPKTTEPGVKKKDTEYERSVSALGEGVTITKDVFQEDKKQILEIIDILKAAMAKQDYSTWFKYVEPASIKFWRDPRNLKKASERLPTKGISLTNLQNYFRYVFIPSRAGKKVDEIRYISDTSIKAVQVQDDTDIVYYYFVKIKGKWMVQLPTL